MEQKQFKLMETAVDWCLPGARVEENGECWSKGTNFQF